MRHIKRLDSSLLAACLCLATIATACGEESTSTADAQGDDTQGVQVDATGSEDVTTPDEDVTTPDEDVTTPEDVDTPGDDIDDTSQPQDVEDDTAQSTDTEEEDTAQSADIEEDTAQPTDTEEDTAQSTDIEEDTAQSTDTETGADEDTTEPDAGPALECTTPCDCENAGEDCVDGVCSLTGQPALCCDDEVCPDGSACIDADGTPGLCGTETSAAFGLLIINEVLSDGTVSGDPNGDGDTSDAVGDEFIELVNAGSESLDISNFTIFESAMVALPRHTFEPGTTLAPGAAMVVFGGGTAPDDTERAQFVVANAQDPGIPMGLALNNDGDAVQVLDGGGALVATFAYGLSGDLEALSDESYCRSPEVTGPFVAHSVASGDIDLLFSPGTKADGSNF